MADSSSMGYALQYAGASGSGFGNMMTNAENQNAKAQLKYRSKWFNSMAQPIGQELQAGYAPGGAIRESWKNIARGDLNQETGQQKQTYGGNAWKYGGSGSPLAQKRWYNQQYSQDAKEANAVNEADLRSNAYLADLATQLRANKWQKNKPQVLTSDPYGWAWDSISNAGSSISGGSSSGGISV